MIETLLPPWLIHSIERERPSSMVEESEEYFDQRGRGRGSGYKQYRRYLWHSGQRLDGFGLRVNNAAADRRVCREGPVDGSVATWQPLGPTRFELTPGLGSNGGLGRINDLAVAPSGDLFAVAATGGLWKKTSDPEARWRPLTNQEIPVPSLSAVVLDPQTSDTLYLLTGDGDGRYAPSIGVLKSIDGGKSWTVTGLTFSEHQFVYGYDLAIHPGGQTLFVATTDGIYRTRDGGQHWSRVRPRNWDGGFYQVVFHPVDPSTVYAAGVKSVWKSTHDGDKDTWTALDGRQGLPPGTDSQRVALAVTPAKPDNLYVLYGGSAGNGYQGLYLSTDRGHGFELRSNSPNILSYQADGASRLGSGIPWYALAMAVSPTLGTRADGTTLPPRIRVGSQNVWESADNGRTWRLISYWGERDQADPAVGFIHNDIHEIVDLGDRIYVASDGGVSLSIDHGKTWHDQSAGLNITQMYKIASTPDSQDVLYFAAQDNGSSILRGGVAHQLVGNIDGTAVLGDSADERQTFVGYQYGGLLKSVPRMSPSELAPTTAPAMTYLDATPPHRSGRKASYVTPFAMDPRSPQTLYGCYADLWRSVDGGAVWENISHGEIGDRHCAALAVLGENDIYVVKGKSWSPWLPSKLAKKERIWHYADGRWSHLSFEHSVHWISDIAVNPEKPSAEHQSQVWVSAAGYGSNNVYALTEQDLGESWQPIMGLPQVPIYSLAYDHRKRALYAGSQCGVYRYDQETGSWSLDSKGMPRMLVMDLEIRNYPDGTRTLFAGTLAQGAWRLQLSEKTTSGPVADPR